MVEVDEKDPSIVHLVLLDQNLPSALATTSRDKAEAAVQILIEAFGYDRVSMTSIRESDLDEYHKVVEAWAADPRMRARVRRCRSCGVWIAPEDSAVLDHGDDASGSFTWIPAVNAMTDDPGTLRHPRCFAYDFGVDALVEVVRAYGGRSRS
jgi:hypothetical protein